MGKTKAEAVEITPNFGGIDICSLGTGWIKFKAPKTSMYSVMGPYLWDTEKTRQEATATFYDEFEDGILGFYKKYQYQGGSTGYGQIKGPVYYEKGQYVYVHIRNGNFNNQYKGLSSFYLYEASYNIVPR